MKIYPAVLTDSLETIQQQVDKAKSCPDVEIVQIDIIDGFFADNITASPHNLLEIDFGDLELDLHLMVEEPMDTILEIATVREHLPLRAIIAQVERMTYQQDFVTEVKKMDLKVGLSLDAYTDLEALDEGIVNQLDIVQFMGIQAGFQEEKLVPFVFEKIEDFFQIHRLERQQENFPEIIFDGGVTEEYLPQIIKLGISSFAIGSTLWQASDFCEQYSHYLQLGE
ncbi:MAG: hypothetical protein COU63_01515 [Candidatus Pacebacteria bacterium CG10_big_fil_rev_8_21_14_0_10_36_11]|nr:hypothetical protein [Candidatus Pacearchaeota archaeon]OIP73734.1 MAG: hypothetical protein AUK08_04205 [Candidatus Pacebacteria bacterium CG2_30_36_39]PIR64680.1 MAG: hypothetical protein COU63_01515 [Candidatus Pacebacteria bacterium CG10_big_fil_rev_8_21_14_0_10_36_11]PJC42749.1 MAG: hypothetical protein CO040_02895 [Candidatus Pacebacteria bacterium CG_4_9_14_0_2_um_filter_36_8]